MPMRSPCLPAIRNWPLPRRATPWCSRRIRPKPGGCWGISTAQVQAERSLAAARIAEKYRAYVVLKGHRSMV